MDAVPSLDKRYSHSQQLAYPAKRDGDFSTRRDDHAGAFSEQNLQGLQKCQNHTPWVSADVLEQVDALTLGQCLSAYTSVGHKKIIVFLERWQEHGHLG
jgi:hypothetical protein